MSNNSPPDTVQKLPPREMRYSVKHFSNNRRKGTTPVGAAISRPLRCIYNLCG